MGATEATEFLFSQDLKALLTGGPGHIRGNGVLMMEKINKLPFSDTSAL